MQERRSFETLSEAPSQGRADEAGPGRRRTLGGWLHRPCRGDGRRRGGPGHQVARRVPPPRGPVHVVGPLDLTLELQHRLRLQPFHRGWARAGGHRGGAGGRPCRARMAGPAAGGVALALGSSSAARWATSPTGWCGVITARWSTSSTSASGRPSTWRMRASRRDVLLAVALCGRHRPPGGPVTGRPATRGPRGP